jgi:hypothetical protein
VYNETIKSIQGVNRHGGAPDSRSIMNKKLVSLSLVFVALFAAFGSAAITQANAWMEYRAADNSFAVSVPAPFRVTAQPIMTPRGPVTAPVFAQQEGGNSYFVAYWDLPANYRATTSQERILESGIMSALQAQGARLNTKSDLSTSGKAFTGTIRAAKEGGQDAALHGRVYFGDGRLFLVYVTSATSNGDNALAAQYLESFRILKAAARR